MLLNYKRGINNDLFVIQSEVTCLCTRWPLSLCGAAALQQRRDDRWSRDFPGPVVRQARSEFEPDGDKREVRRGQGETVERTRTFYIHHEPAGRAVKVYMARIHGAGRGQERQSVQISAEGMNLVNSQLPVILHMLSRAEQQECRQGLLNNNVHHLLSLFKL